MAHGSRDPRAAATVEALLDRVRQARPDLPVRSAYLDHGPPTLGQALHGLREAVVLPLLLTEAYHSRVDLPAALAEARARDPLLRVRYGTTLGPHPLLLRALERRLSEAGVRRGDPDTALVLVSAGSSDARANAVIAELASTWSTSWDVPRLRGGAEKSAARRLEAHALGRTPGSGLDGASGGDLGAAHESRLRTAPENGLGTTPGSELKTAHESGLGRALEGGSPGAGWWGVVPAYASAAGPTPAEAVAALRAAGAPRVAVAPYLLAPGFFADKVRRDALAAGADVVADVLGPSPELVEVVLERYTSALRHEPVRVPA
ncbi:sirohydrochlorin chelatase [Nonomuraea africana]|uniref:sirohydrochlorin chelatase n=1 Tax=Nonomuraea africana TaxID=46171 RepID=UPI003403D80C